LRLLTRQCNLQLVSVHCNYACSCRVLETAVMTSCASCYPGHQWKSSSHIEVLFYCTLIWPVSDQHPFTSISTRIPKRNGTGSSNTIQASTKTRLPCSEDQCIAIANCLVLARIPSTRTLATMIRSLHSSSLHVVDACLFQVRLLCGMFSLIGMCSFMKTTAGRSLLECKLRYQDDVCNQYRCLC
jgi:hypothetical protein